MQREQIVNRLDAIFRSGLFTQNIDPAKLEQLGYLWALLKGGCEFDASNYPVVRVFYKGFEYFESLEDEGRKGKFRVEVPVVRTLPAPIAPMVDENLPEAFHRSRLIEICQMAIVPEEKWRNRDSAAAQKQVGTVYAFLCAGMNYVIKYGDEWEPCITDPKTIWLDLLCNDRGEEECYDTAYLPTRRRLQEREGLDWY